MISRNGFRRELIQLLVIGGGGVGGKRFVQPGLVVFIVADDAHLALDLMGVRSAP